MPGCVHTDLLAAGLIPDPLLHRNEELLGWIGEADWTYSTRFAAGVEGYERVDLVCSGLDTVARVELNGVLVGSTANMHRSYRFDVTEQILLQGNELEVTFASATAYARAQQEALGAAPRGVRGPVQLHPQDGLQLRLGLGTGAGHRRHLAAHRSARVEHGPARVGPAAGHRRRRRHGPGRPARRRRALRDRCGAADADRHG